MTRLIDAEKIDFKGIWGSTAIRRQAEKVIEAQPTVDAVELPCKIGAKVYAVPSKVNYALNILAGLEKNNRVYCQEVVEITFRASGWYMMGSADEEYGTGRIFRGKSFGETWFLSEEDAQDKLAALGGGAEK